MQNLSKTGKLVLILLIVTIAGFIFYSLYGKNNFTGLKDGIKPNNAVNVDEEKSADISTVKSIYVETSSDDINFLTSDTNEVKAHFYGYYSSGDKGYKPEFTVTMAGGELRIKVEYKLHIGIFSSNFKLDVYLPSSYSSSLEIHTSSANVNIDKINKLENFTCKTTSGDLNAKSVNAGKAEVGSSSGSLKISGIFDNFISKSTSGNFTTGGIAAKSVAISTSSGSIKANVSADYLQLHTTSGDITADPVSIKSCKSETSSGRTTLRGVPGNLDASSTSGDIILQCNELASNMNIKTSSGSTEIKLPQNAEFHLKYQSSSGNGKCDFPIAITGLQEQNNLEGTVISDRNDINVNSTSGNLDIHK